MLFRHSGPFVFLAKARLAKQTATSIQTANKKSCDLHGFDFGIFRCVLAFGH